MRLLLLGVFLGAAVLPVQSCDENDAVAVRIKLSADGSGTVTTSFLSLPAQGAAGEAAVQGVTWKARALLTCATGSFDDLGKLKIEDLSFSSGGTPDGSMFLRVTMPRGPEVRWVRAMTPHSAEDRKKASESFALAGNAKKAGSAVKFEVEAPKPVVAHGIYPKARGASEAVDEKHAEVVVPIDTVLSAGDPLIWQITWQK